MNLKGRRQSNNVLNLKNPDDLRKHEAQTAIDSARWEQTKMAYRSKNLTDPRPLSEQKPGKSYSWYNNQSKVGFKRLTRETGVPAGKLKK